MLQFDSMFLRRNVYGTIWFDLGFGFDNESFLAEDMSRIFCFLSIWNASDDTSLWDKCLVLCYRLGV